MEAYSSNNNKTKTEKFYAVSVGRQTGIFTTWNMASASVNGFPKAAHKSYETLEEAKEAMRLAGIVDPAVFTHQDQIGDVDEETVPKLDYRQHEIEIRKCVCEALHSTGRSLKCTECARKVNWECTELPPYQLLIFSKSSRKYTCKVCADIMYGDERLEEEIAAQLPDINGSKALKEKCVPAEPDTISRTSFEVHTQKIGSTLRNLEGAITNLTEQLVESEKARREEMELISSWQRDRSHPAHPPPPPPLPKQQSVTAGSDVQPPPSPQRGSMDQNPNSGDEGNTDPSDPVRAIPVYKANSRREGRPNDTEENNNSATPPSYHASSSSSSSSSSSEDEDETDTEDNESDVDTDTELQRVVLLHDSVMHGVDQKRLGKSYGFLMKKSKTATIEECRQHIKSRSSTKNAEVVCIHSGINDLKRDAPQAVSENLTALVTDILKRQKPTKVVISKTCPVKDRALQAKVDLLNALNASFFLGEDRVSFLDHSNLKPDNKNLMRDPIHPSARGTSILASNLGKHIESLLWEKPRRTFQRREKGSTGSDRKRYVKDTKDTRNQGRGDRERHSRPQQLHRQRMDRRRPNPRHREASQIWRYRDDTHWDNDRLQRPRQEGQRRRPRRDTSEGRMQRAPPHRDEDSWRGPRAEQWDYDRRPYRRGQPDYYRPNEQHKFGQFRYSQGYRR